jgi:hypothetical protein
MISVSGKKWAEQKINKNLVEKIKQDYGHGGYFITVNHFKRL